MSIHEGVAAKTSKDGGPAANSAFNRHVLSLLEQIEYRYCEGGEDLEAIYRLRYESYLNAGMLRPDASRMVTDRYDDLPNSYRYGVFFEGNLVSTIRLHYVSKKFPLSPSVSVFPDILEPRIAAGETFIDPSRFAASSEWSSSLRVLPYITLRLAVIACKYFDTTACLTAIKEEHSAFYHRIFRSVPATEPRHYPGLTVPVNLMYSKCSDNMEHTIRRFPFFNSTAMERRLLFGARRAGKPAPLTVLPTAKYFEAA